MKRRSKHFGGMSEFRYIAAIFISDLIGTTTIFGNGLSRGRVLIKVMFTLCWNLLWHKIRNRPGTKPPHSLYYDDT
jgi:hypothetical protein